MNRTVAVTTLGCKTNQYESAAMEERLIGAGYEILPFEEGAELVIVNTCTVTAATDRQSRNLIRRARRLNPAARIVVTGCYAQVAPDKLMNLPGVALVIGNAEKKEFLDLLQDVADTPRVKVSDIGRTREAVALPLSRFADRSRAFVQIQNGCDAFCSYCIIPHARGRSRSLAPDEALEQVRQLVEHGYPEIVLTGIHIGGYGADLSPATSLHELVARIEEETAVRRLRLGSIEPTEIPAALVARMAASQVVCPHFHIPLQSGDDEILKRMNRLYDTAFFRRTIMGIHSRMPEGAIGLDVIVGFPGETEEQFANTCRFVEELPATHLHVFPFSKRPGTPAALMPDQVAAAVIKERAARLRALGEEKNRAYAQRFIGRTLEVVVEGGGSVGSRKGLSRNYLQISFPGSEALIGKVVPVKVTALGDGGLEGSLA
ncbi:tRNA (N(6)-L-threonylcarbamoyladenosine(37)-C(2))-methylthiotransferase MtaB [Geoalkalibacter halelectricus]|uniref:tRNA (N(6)-L-threonylcarbamoyladenosine(37)-C(2))-methylthiotransferase n=1 Tax=Geoalkalibacter halelectricus TaxID=2847045 RepID=A0ABY5ZG03_9BACT|nr:tRNA (N(6)-L-threonylcarbamoyladenosine(37)-C(2))-methylthiotransferase MtaB [Geoalkalibacter halelectricus]MDO3379499.1 tRNA (N(6)-L-threonylcarbamoyladenosine(37)-C(2))-methylthiotransferase MtaB [Geoalkalibacter halelectricus]UWZ78090.1 tRNA (N(6)-L-threonylcarbamoyladenosine(37)-C(2))-methylthiotransferase MtaB [Geoalkalibacter halelectricus]